MARQKAVGGGGVNVYYLYAAVIFAGMGILTYGTELPFLNSYTARGYMSFFLGIVIKEMWKHANIKRTEIQLLSWLLLAGIVISVIFGSANMDFIVVFLLWPAVITICHSEWFSKAVSRRFWSDWARVSFDVYIWHRVLLTLYLFIPSENRGWLLSVRGMLLTILLAEVAGWLSYHLIEMPLNRRIKKVERERYRGRLEK